MRSVRATSIRRWSKRRSRARPRRTAFRATRSFATCCWRSSRTSVSPPSKSSARWPSSSRATRPHRSPAWHCRWMAAGPRTRTTSSLRSISRRARRSTLREDEVLDVTSARHGADAQEHEACGDGRAQTQRQTVLVFQGGGALGAYQAGVYQALHEAGIEPDWIIGTSIGAINASLIAGNAPQNRLSRLREFWKRMEQSPVWSFRDVLPGFNEKLSYWSTVTNGIPGFFRPNALAHAGDSYPLGTDRAGYYSTEPLQRTLHELVDFELMNTCRPRLTVGAAHVRTSRMRYFD